MRPGVVGAALVVLAGGATAGATVLKDRTQLRLASEALEAARARLDAGELTDAEAAFLRALVTADGVGGLTGLREPALDVAEAARRGLDATRRLARGAERPDRALSALDADGGVLGRPPGPALAEQLARWRAGGLIDAGLALEAAGARAAAPVVLAEAAAAGEAAGHPRAAEVAQALVRARLRATLEEAEAAVAAGDDLRGGAAARELGPALEAAAGAFAPEDLAALRARVEAALAEVEDRAAVQRFGGRVDVLWARVPTNDLGALLPEVEAAAPPALRGGYARAPALGRLLADHAARRERVLGAARDFAGMVLATRRGNVLVFVDRTEVTNEAFARFVAADGYAAGPHWSPEGARNVDRLRDLSGKPGPRGWREGAPPPGEAQHPVAGVCYFEAEAFAAWSGKRLPTLDEWRAAAGRAAGFPWGDAWREGAGRVAAAGVEGPAPVGSHPDGAAPSGALDLIGNVRELVAVPGAAKPASVGGSFRSLPDDARLEREPDVAPWLRAADTGFRCARELTW